MTSREGAGSAFASAEFALRFWRLVSSNRAGFIKKSGPPRANTSSLRGSTMHETHRRAAEEHELAARAHRTAAEHNEKGDRTAADFHSERALEYSDHAYRLAQEAHSKSGRVGRF